MKLEGVVTHGIKLNAVGCVSNEVVIAFGPIGSYVDMSQFYSMEQTDALLGDKADKVDTYTKDETDALLDTKADKSTTYTKNEVDEMMSNVDTEPTEGSTNFVTSGGVFNALEKKVNVVPGKGLSSHDFTSAYKTKLIGIEEGAERNIIERIYVNGYLLPVENKNVNIPAATNTMAGVMSASDKRKLNEMLSAVVVKVSDRHGTYEADKTLTDLDIAISQGMDVLYIVNNAYYYRMSFYVPTQCVIAVRMNLNEPLMDNAKASYLYHTITGVTVNSLELASVADLPTDLSDLNNDVGFITSQALANYADGAEYDSTTHYIYLKHGNTRLPNPINAADFIKDGMVETVTVGKPATGQNAGVDCLIVTFNTDAGESPIELPLTKIFDPTNYYTKTEVDTALDGKANSSDLASVATSGSYNDLSDKPTIPTVPTNVSAFVNDAGYLTSHQSLSDYYSKGQVDTLLDGKKDAEPTEMIFYFVGKSALISALNNTSEENPVTLSGNALTQWNALMEDARDTKRTWTYSFQPVTVNYNNASTGNIIFMGSVTSNNQEPILWEFHKNGDNYWMLRTTVSYAKTSDLSSKQDALTFDSTPTANSTNPVTSQGIKTELDGKANKAIEIIEELMRRPNLANALDGATEDNPATLTGDALTEWNGLVALYEDNENSWKSWNFPMVTDIELWQNSGIMGFYGIPNNSWINTVQTFEIHKSGNNWWTDTSTTSYQKKLTFDSTPTSSSTNPVTSGGVYTALSNKQDTLVSGTSIKTINNVSVLGSGNIDADDVVHGALRGSDFVEGDWTNEGGTWTYSIPLSGGVITPNENKIYVDVSTNKIYRWKGSYVQIGGGDVTEMTNAEVDTIMTN